MSGPFTSLKLLLRDLFSAALGFIPLRLLQPLRQAHARAPAGSSRAAALDALMHLLRYRRVDDSVRSFTLPDEPGLSFVNVNSFIARRVYWLGRQGYEGHESEWWAYFCRRSHKVLEVGANIGFYTVIGAHAAPQTPYLAVEPHPRSAAILRQNLLLNKTTAVSVLEAALVGRKTIEHLELSVPYEDGYDSPCGAFVTSGLSADRDHAAATVEVEVAEARDVVDGVDLLKIDVEGHEYEILASVGDWLRDNRPAMFIEVLPDARELRLFLYDICDLYGYQPYAIGPADLEAAPAEALLDPSFPGRHGTRDVLLVTDPEAFGIPAATFAQKHSSAVRQDDLLSLAGSGRG